jgi:general secretion pathway protein L
LAPLAIGPDTSPSVLILTPASFSLTGTPSASAAVDWATSANGQQVLEQGTGPVSALPAQDEVVLVLPPQSVSWHRLTLPKVPTSRMRALLEGMLEERLLSDTAELHFALAPGAKPGQATWCAACHKTWVKNWLQALENAGRPVTRIVPGLAPSNEVAADGTPAGTVHWAHHQSGQAWLASASALGVSCTRLGPQSAAALAGVSAAAGAEPVPMRWLADPATAAMAEQCLDQRFELMTQPNWLLRCAQSEWNLAQFDLSLSNSARRGQRWRQTWRQWRTAPAWKAARWGLLALIAVQIIGVNAAAWQERRTLQAKQAALRQILQSTFPQVKLVVDAPIQMQREISLMRQSSGQLSANDLQAMLAGLAQASGEQSLVLQSLQYQQTPNGAEGRFGTNAAAQANWPDLQAALKRAGWLASLDGTTITLRPSQP